MLQKFLNAIFLIGAIIVLIVAIVAFTDQDYDSAWFMAGVGGVMLFVWFFEKRHEKHAEDFLVWLHGQRDQLQRGPVFYNGKMITQQSELVRFETALSVIILSKTFPSRYFIVGQENTAGSKIQFSLFALLFGWWGIPWGPIFTIRSIWRNIHEKHKTTVQKVLQELAG